MSLHAQIKESRQRLGEKHTAAKALALFKNAEEQAQFEKLTKLAADEAMVLRGLEARQQVDEMQGLIDGPLAPELGVSTVSSIADRLSGGGGYIELDKSTIMHDRHQRIRRFSHEEQMERFGIPARDHHKRLRQYIRSIGTTSEEMSKQNRELRELLGGKPFSEAHLHSILDDTLGGFTVSEDFRATLVKALAGASVVRASGARVVQTSKPAITMPSLGRALANPKQYSSDLTQGDGNWKPEGFTSGGTARTPQNLPTFGMERIPVHIWQPDPVELTMELISDSDFDLEGVLAELFGETMGLDTDIAFLLGNGLGKPEGIVNGGSPGVPVGKAATYTTPTANDNGFNYPRLVSMTMSLAAQYRQRAVYYMNSDTYGRLLSIEASDGHPIFPVNQSVGTLWGRPIYFTEFLPNGSSTANIPILFGDPRFYVIAERRNMTIMRLTERYAPNIALLPTARIGGQLILKEAFVRGTVIA